MATKKATVSAEFVAVDKSLGAKIDEINNKLNALSKSSQGTFATTMVAAIDIAINKIQQFGAAIYEVAQRGASFALLENEFTKLSTAAGENSKQVIASLTEASQKSIAQRDLFLAANRANLLGVAKTEEELSELLRIAIVRGDALGVSTTQAFDNIVTGLGRQSALILDNLGIVIEVEATMKDYAESVGKTVTALTDEERKHALVNKVIEDSNHLLEHGISVASQNQNKVESLSAAWKNLGDNLSASVSGNLAEASGQLATFIAQFDTFTQKLQGDLAKGYFESIRKSLEDLTATDPNRIFTADVGFLDNLASGGDLGEIGSIIKNAGLESATASEIIGILNGNLAGLQEAADTTGSSIAQLDSEIVATSNSLFQLSVDTEAVKNANLLFEERMRLSSDAINYLAISSANASSELGLFEAQLLSLQRSNAQFESSINGITNSIISQAVGVQKLVGTDVAKNLASSALQQLNADTEQLKEGLQSGELSALDLALTFGSIEDDLLSPFVGIQEENRKAQAALTATNKGVNKLAQESEQAFNQLQSQVSSVLSGSLNAGIDVESLLPRQDSIEEDARRLADVAVNGFDSPWLDYFKDEFPALFQKYLAGATSDSGIKTQAANLIKDFQDGLVPELLDRETAKERVRRALIGQQNMEELAREIAGELASEFGQSVSSVQSVANQVLGGGSSLSLPTPEFDTDSLDSVSKQFESGVKGSLSGFGDSFATFIADQFSAKVVLENVGISGRQNGEIWGSNFLTTVGDNVPPQLVELLSMMVLPNIEKQLNQTSNQESAR